MTRRSHEWVDEHTGVRIVSTPDTLCGAWRLDGHRIDTAGIAALWRAGETVDAIARCYMISVDQVEACILFESTGPGEHARLRAAVLELWDSIVEWLEPIVRAIAELVKRMMAAVDGTLADAEKGSCTGRQVSDLASTSNLSVEEAAFVLNLVPRRELERTTAALSLACAAIKEHRNIGGCDDSACPLYRHPEYDIPECSGGCTVGLEWDETVRSMQEHDEKCISHIRAHYMAEAEKP